MAGILALDQAVTLWLHQHHNAVLDALAGAALGFAIGGMDLAVVGKLGLLQAGTGNGQPATGNGDGNGDDNDREGT